MKKKLVITIALTIIIIASFVIYHFIKAVKVEESSKQEVVITQPSNYCLITYQVSKDNAKTWQKITVDDGMTPSEKAECWKKYLLLLKEFKTGINEDKKWYGENSDGQPITKPAMKFSEKPFTKVKKSKKSSKNESSTDEANLRSD
ncbi:hypothetical protein EDC55_11029 [Allofrancisella inopinata]|uniref:Uncharacterized protein n=1 Tax=Allofrancisella inopinata TaxID=1085647 RepID=A0AAE6YHW8_9GAMM|nr:hypothetical protein [Allofrancisella inopinata]QIV96038.1 hypothetical protein E4K63_04025 [Allofrancisella inopinata]TDT71696.1 hypothetical protein EDC55_11029 [Allofrancisella inopinata]